MRPSANNPFTRLGLAVLLLAAAVGVQAASIRRRQPQQMTTTTTSRRRAQFTQDDQAVVLSVTVSTMAPLDNNAITANPDTATTTTTSTTTTTTTPTSNINNNGQGGAGFGDATQSNNGQGAAITADTTTTTTTTTITPISISVTNNNGQDGGAGVADATQSNNVNENENNQDNTTPNTSSSNNDYNVGSACPTREFVDVVIIGAGMAGIAAAAALQQQDPTLTYRILESTDHVGGRVRSTQFGGITIEDGANWIIDFDGNPMRELAEQYQLVAPVNDYTDYKTYGEDGLPMDPAFVQDEQDRFTKAWDKAAQEADNQWDSNHESYPDLGVRALLADQGWTIRPGSEGSLEYAIEWFILDWEYAAHDTSVRYFPYDYQLIATLVSDPRGYEFLPQSYLQTNANPNNLRIKTRVTKINYNENFPFNGKTYSTLVNTQVSDSNTNDPTMTACTDYYAQRVISTVSTGVLSNDLIAFNPPLQYPDDQYNPYYMTQYVKIFYQFPAQFWDNNQLIRVLRDEQHRGHCHHWANMNMPGFNPGSNIIRCEIMTEAFEELKDPVTQDLSQETLLALLDPLRTAYGVENVPAPMDIYYPKLNKDADFGFGAYGNWKIGKTFTDFAHFFGGVEDLVPYCEHNGCNSAGRWTMVLSGSAACYEHSEFVHGAFFAGEKAAKIVLKELGYAIDEKGVSPCDIDWHWLRE